MPMPRHVGSGRALLNPVARNPYLVEDLFQIPLGAGSINGTLAAPGGLLGTAAQNTRTVVDTNSKISISGGALNFATGEQANDGVWWGSQTRTTGRILICSFNLTSGNIRIGWDTNQSGALATNSIRLSGTNLSIGDSSASGIIAVIANGTVYRLTIILRAKGIFALIKGGAFTNWTMLWEHSGFSGDTTASVFPNINSDSTTGVIAVTNFDLPSNLYLPIPANYDTFTRADGALGSSEATGPDSQACLALAWTLVTGTITVSSNTAVCGAVVGGLAYATVSPATADILIGAAITRTAGNGGIILRYQDSSNYIIAYVDGTNAKLDKVVAGSTTNVISAAVTYGAGNLLYVFCSGTSFILYYNGAKVGSTSTISDAALQSSVACGVYGTDTSCVWDLFRVFPRGTSGEYNALNAY